MCEWWWYDGDDDGDDDDHDYDDDDDDNALSNVYSLVSAMQTVQEKVWS